MHDEIEVNYSFTLILLNKNIDYLCSNLHTHMLATQKFKCRPRFALK
jgi:hypothetical protein